MKFFRLILACLISLSPSGGAADPRAVLTELEARYAEDRAASLRAVLARYADELETLQTKLLKAGDASGAARVQLERDRILPALGLPGVAAADADEFAAFEEPPPVPPLPKLDPTATMGDLDAILKTLLPTAAPGTVPVPSSTRTDPVSPAAMKNKSSKRVLRMTGAQLAGSYDPGYGYVYWSYGRSASWTLNDLAPGSYRLHLRYSCDEKDGGGKLRAKFGTGTMEVDVPSTGNWKRKRDLIVGPFEITESRADLILAPVNLRPGASYLMDLTAVLVQPADAPSPP